MKALDTNILARYLRDDDASQSAKAARLMQRAVQQHEPLFINHVVLCELTSILTAVYDHSKRDLIEMIDSFLAAKYLEFEDRETIQPAVEDYRRSKSDFADSLIRRRNIVLGCESTLTFDRNVRTLENFQIL